MPSKKVGVEEGMRLDEALVSWGAAPTRSKVQSLIKDGAVTINGKVEKAHCWLKNGDIVNYQIYTEKPLTLDKEDIPLNIVYEDPYLLVINKPAGLVVHPGNGHSSGTLVNALLYHEDELAHEGEEGNVRPGIVHRIDKDTSGLLAVAKTDEAFAGLAAQLADHSMHREYYALVKGIIDEEDAKIDAPIGRDPTHPTKFCVNGLDSREAITYFHVEKRFPISDVTFISCRLLTGRTHQIRVHLDYISHPVIGDPLYGEGNRKIYDKGQLLHAYRLTFVHPITKKEMTFEAPLPDYFTDILNKLK
jgi:23S rRNA pseudouridine1911/1915/1917 synthase